MNMVSISPTRSIVSPAVKLSYDVVKGSPKDRHELVTRYTDKVFDDFMGKMDDYSVSFATLRKSIDKTLPEKKKYEIHSFIPNDEAVACADYKYDGDDIIGQKLFVPAKNKRLPLDQVIPFMHELTHIFDRLTNPKITARVVSGMAHNIYENKEFNKLLSEKLYNYEDVSAFTSQSKRNAIIGARKRQVKKFLKDKPVEKQIEYIQDLKNSLTTEKNAFDAEHRYALKLQERDLPAPNDSLNNSREEFMFDDKIKMLKKLGIEIIQKERKAHAEKLAKPQKISA